MGTPLYDLGCAAGQGVVFVLSVLNRVYNFVQDCPKQGNKIEGVVLNRVCILGIFSPKQVFALPVWGAYIWRDFTCRGLFSEFYTCF